MSRKITIYKYEGNTDWSVEVEDKYGKLHHIGYFKDKALEGLDGMETVAEGIWKNEVEPKEDLLSDAIAECIQMDIERGVEPNLD